MFSATPEQVGLCNGKVADVSYGDGPVTAHLLFHFEQALEEDRAFGHYSLLATSRTRTDASGQDFLMLPEAVAWHTQGLNGSL